MPATTYVHLDDGETLADPFTIIASSDGRTSIGLLHGLTIHGPTAEIAAWFATAAQAITAAAAAGPEQPTT